jgi:DNA-binding transcriptional MerR regulator
MADRKRGAGRAGRAGRAERAGRTGGGDAARRAAGAAKGKAVRRDAAAESPAEDGAALDGKRYYRIGEVARITGVKPYVLRYWESEFRWMAPAKSRSLQRLYRKRDIEIIQLIKRLLYEERFTIAGARRKLQELGVGRALSTRQLDLRLEGHPREQLRRIRNELEEIRASLL